MVIISRKEYERIAKLKELDIQQCYFCQKINILNLGWKAWAEHYCLQHEKKHVLCPRLCLLVTKNILDCELIKDGEKETKKEVVKPNRPYDWANCYLCCKELRGAGKTGKIKNRNNPVFWGISCGWKIMCLACLGRKFYGSMASWQAKKYREYRRRGYV